MIGVIPFRFDDMQVRVVTRADGEPWFVAADVLAVLALDRKALDRLDDDEKGMTGIHTLGGPQDMTIVSEPGLYVLVLGSRKPEARRFKRWVTREVLRSIRRTGEYGQAPINDLVINVQAARAFPAFFDVARLLGCDQNAAAISANQYVLKLSQVNLMAGLGRTHLEALSQQDQYFTPTELGKRQKLSGQAMNQLLLKAGLQTKHGKVWELTEAGRQFGRIYDTGKRHGSGTPVSQVKWSSAVLEKIAAH
ncbi:BRO family protein [Pseudacidovorax intermedius]|uniref:BRO-N domain-containing protein n=1 Tax=Pseudacidovorax intermedius TaxID=433924 RepID=UPI0026E9B363|nr:BRO family protein [Pseudacidovorax intermedius]